MSDIDRIVGEWAAKQHGVFRARQIDGLTKANVRSRVDSGRWRRIEPGVFIVEGSPNTWEQQLWLRLLTSGPGAVVGLRTAIVLHVGRGGYGPIDIVQPEVTVPGDKPGRARRTKLLPAAHVTVVRGFPVTTYERTLFDLAALVSPRRRRRNLPTMTEARVARLLDDAIVAGRVSVASMRHVHRVLAGRGRGGTTVMRALLEARGEGFVATESQLEDRFVELLGRFGLPSARRQVEVGSNGEWLGRIDFYFADAKLIVEADGTKFHDQRSVAMRDRRRDLKMSARGWMVIRVDWWQLTEEPARVAAELRQVLAHRTAS
ncbi:MAG: DUF559 domain-containing protein [Actinobacteria bacterium]|nr:DUF559 domain-containing protein [Actinomycetota bacterium]